jgi:hypothetical protein
VHYLNAFDDQNPILGFFNVSSHLRCQFSIPGIDFARFQRAAKCAN